MMSPDLCVVEGELCKAGGLWAVLVGTTGQNGCAGWAQEVKGGR